MEAYARVQQKFVNDQRPLIDDVIHGWPAEAGTGVVFMQPYKDVSTDDKKRRARWEAFAIFVHEFMHIVTHPNFARTAQLLGGSAQKYMIEGFAEVMRRDLWAGRLTAKIPADKALRKNVEGGDYPYDSSVVQYGNEYSEVAQALEIVNKVGIANGKTAFFLGHTELLGIGQGSQSTYQSPGATADNRLAGTANYSASASAEENIYVTKPSDNYLTIKVTTGAKDGDVKKESDKSVVTAATALPHFTRLVIPGIRWVEVIRGDTLKSVAAQHGLTVAALKQANGLHPSASDTDPFAPGRFPLLIPIH